MNPEWVQDLKNIEGKASNKLEYYFICNQAAPIRSDGNEAFLLKVSKGNTGDYDHPYSMTVYWHDGRIY